MPEGSSGCETANTKGNNGQQVTHESEPDDIPGRSVSVDFGQHIAKKIAQRKNDNTGGDQKSKEENKFHSDNICRDQTGDKNTGNNDKPERYLQTRLSFIKSARENPLPYREGDESATPFVDICSTLY